MLLSQTVMRAALRLLPRAGSRMPMSSAMMAMTTRSSMRVNAGAIFDFGFSIVDCPAGLRPPKCARVEAVLGTWLTPESALSAGTRAEQAGGVRPEKKKGG